MRETAKERKEREALEEQARLAQLTAQYPAEMMLVLEQATKEDMKLSVSNFKGSEPGELFFVVHYEDDEFYADCAYFGQTYSYGNQAMLNKLKAEFERRQFVRDALAKRKALAASARAKLTPEELEALTYE